jgi:hypothetical protein
LKFIDEGARDDLAKSSTILQCILAILDFECNKSHTQPEIVGVDRDIAMVAVDLDMERMLEICEIVNKQFKRKDHKFTCIVSNEIEGFIECEALPLDQYEFLT